jgi:putative spermidine/putrescine transport system ATP-binding protein
MARSAGGGTLTAKVETIEYRGRGFVGTGRTAAGLELVFRSHDPVAIGAEVGLDADERRVLVFSEPA